MTLFPNYHRAPVTFTQAQNATWFDDQGQAYSDLTSGIGVYNIGATHPKVVAALTQQAEKYGISPTYIKILCKRPWPNNSVAMITRLILPILVPKPMKPRLNSHVW